MNADHGASGEARQGLFPEVAPRASGMLRLDPVHAMYWEESGSPDGIPVVFLHGGPPVKEYDGNAIRAPAFLPVHGMHRIEPEHSGGARRNFRKQPLPCLAGCAVIGIHGRADDKLFPATPGHFIIFFRRSPFPGLPGAGYFPG